MNKRNAAAENGAEDAEASNRGLSGLLQSAPVVERLRNPFADDEDDDDDDDAENNHSDEEAEEGGRAGEGGGGGSAGSWHRGGWWRGVVRRRGGNTTAKDGEKERFGDGRDDSSDDREDEDDEDDEEFGDFAMPDDAGAATAGTTGGGVGGDREKVLLKPLPVHPPPAGSSKFGSIWPFDQLGFGSKEKGREEGLGAGVGAVGSEKPGAEEEPEVVDEDGNKVSRAIEAKRRTSIEDPDEDEEVVV